MDGTDIWHEEFLDRSWEPLGSNAGFLLVLNEFLADVGGPFGEFCDGCNERTAVSPVVVAEFPEG